MSKLTPMMKQYTKIKANHKDSILFFRLGDFYEMFFDDAILASKELEIALTSRNCGKKEKAPMCGIPCHSANSYISKLVKRGYKVAICEQVQDPSEAKGIVKREVIRIVTPGTITDINTLDEKNNNYLCCIYLDSQGVGISYVDITTGDMYTTQMIYNKNNNYKSIIDELAKILPTEIISNKYIYNQEALLKGISTQFNIDINCYSEWAFDEENARNRIKEQFNIATLEGYGIENKKYCIKSTGALVEYLFETQKMVLKHLNTISNYSVSNYMILDINTRRNLELIETIRDKVKKGSLLWLLDKTCTAMGGRLLKKWIEEPLKKIKNINWRLNIVEYFVDNFQTTDEVKKLLSDVYDIERLLSKISYGNCNGRDLIALKKSIRIIPDLKKVLHNIKIRELKNLASEMDDLNDIYSLIDRSIVDDPPVSIMEGGIIKNDYNNELKELKQVTDKGKKWITNLQKQERKKTGIKSLKVGFNKVFGYYIEVTKANLDLVPDNYNRKQTLANSERYITPELKEVENNILGAEEKSTKLEYEIFTQIRNKIKRNVKRIQACAKKISIIDVLTSLAKVAYKNNYVKPKLNKDKRINIKNGRHPVVENMQNNKLFVPNDTILDNSNNRLAIITGPNMAGKSTYMRQVALISIMAQIGSFVSADSADMCIVDRIFTRVGATDDLSQGQSTFMVEMSEVANILNNSTENSLLILDEIGRGTSTYDGLSIAWSVIEYIANRNIIGAKTLFATHYHELTELEGKIDGVKNYNILVKEQGDDIIFLRKISRGGADKSYGIEVAKLAGVPNEVIKRAKVILEKIEERNIDNNTVAITCEEDGQNKNYNKENVKQLDFFNIKEKEIINNIKQINMMKTTPLDAINILYELVEKVKDLEE